MSKNSKKMNHRKKQQLVAGIIAGFLVLSMLATTILSAFA